VLILFFFRPKEVQEQIDSCVVIHFHNAVEDTYPLERERKKEKRNQNKNDINDKIL